MSRVIRLPSPPYRALLSRFVLSEEVHRSGTVGWDVVGEGVVFSDGSVALRHLGEDRRGIELLPSVEAARRPRDAIGWLDP